MTDADALARFTAQNAPDAFAHLVAKHVHVVYTSAFRQLRDTTLADRATQAAFLLLARHARSLGATTPVMPWLFTATHGVCREMSRRGGGGVGPRSNDSGRAPLPNFAAPSDWATLSPQIDDAIVALPPGPRAALLLKYVANLPLRDVADALGVSDEVAGQRINAGVARLRRFFVARNLHLPPDALVASLQAHAVREAPPVVAFNTAAVVTAPPGDDVAPLADAVSAQLLRAKAARAVAVAVVLAVLGLLAVRVATAVRNAPHVTAAASQPVTTAASPLPQASAPSPVLPVAPSPAQLPAAKPIKPVDPVLAERFLAAVRASNFAAVENYASVDENVVNVHDPQSNQPAVQVAAELVSWQRRESAKIAHFLIDNGAATDLHTAARAGHAHYVAVTLIADPRRINAPDARGLTPLQRAALIPGSSPECEAVVDLLISVGATVDLCTAATFGRIDDAKRALAADPTAVNRPVLGGTPLHWAARPRRHGADPLAIAKLLLDAGADPRAADTRQDGMTPLHHAAEWGAPVALLGLLLEKGGDVNAPDDYAWTPLDYATDRNHKELVAFLTEKGGRLTTARFPNQPSKSTRFFAAVRDDDAKLVEVLLNDTPELATTRGPTGETPLHWAAAQGNTAIIDLLLAEKADINAQEANRHGGTPLHWAVRHGQSRTAQLLMEKGADPKATNSRNGQTALHVAARHTDDAALVDLFLSLGVDKSAKDRFGKTAREYAESTGHTKVVGKL